LLIIDEVGFKKIPLNYVDEFFEIIRQRYETNSVIVTTNRPFENGEIYLEMWYLLLQ
jgi:DNA replication protein DnaC